MEQRPLRRDKICEDLLKETDCVHLEGLAEEAKGAGALFPPSDL